jgi:hypothetical protein
MDNQPACNIALALRCITLIAISCVVAGSFLLWKGYDGGGVLVSAAASGMTGLIGMISMRNAPPPPPPDTTATQAITTVTTPNPPTTTP